MANNENGFESELGSRNYRPDYPADHVREHKVFWPQRFSAPYAIKRMRSAGALHRAIFVAAASMADGYFLDLMQVEDEIPVPFDRAWCGILNDDEPTRGGAKGPNFFHQSSLATLLRAAKTIVVSSVGARASNYQVSCDRTAHHGENCLLIESQYPADRAWMEYVETRGGGRYTLIKEAPNAHDWLAENMVKNKAWRNVF